MAKRTDRIAAYLSTKVIEASLTVFRDNGNSDKFGIVSVRSVKVTPDYSYADVYVSCERNVSELPKALAPLAKTLRGDLSRNGLCKSPIIRFKTADEASDGSEARLVSLIESLNSHETVSS